MVAGDSRTHRELLEAAVEALEPIIDRIVFVGGVTTILYISREFDDLRATADVDVIVDTNYSELTELEELLRNIGFVPDPEVICRHRKENLVIDLMPVDSSVLGFSNRWYAKALEHVEVHRIANTEIKLISFPYFVATKLEAFASRGKGDYLGSEDMEDLITVLAGRPSFLVDLIETGGELLEFIRAEFARHLQSPDFRDALVGNFPRDPVLSIERVLVDLEELAADCEQRSP
ncbi:MAG: hypothetical protein V3S47_05395 [Acidobacteriota bacterium]